MSAISSFVSSLKDNAFSIDKIGLTKSILESSASMQTAFSCSYLGLAGGCKLSV